jgi:hypothetical protein
MLASNAPGDGFACELLRPQPPEKKAKVDKPVEAKEAAPVVASAAPTTAAAAQATTVGKASVLGPIARAGEGEQGVNGSSG